MTETIGILGAGKLGTTLARLAVHADYPVLIASRKSVAELRWIIDTLAPGATTVDATTLFNQADVVILAIPLTQVQQLDPAALAGKLVLDATNFWPEVDGTINHVSSLTYSSAEATQAHLADSLVAKAFNHMGYHDLEIEVDRHPQVPRAMAFATDHDQIRKPVAALIQRFGFAPYDLGPLAAGIWLEPGSPLFGAALPTADFAALYQTIRQSPYGLRVAAARQASSVTH